jgi:hypothetical protein
MKAKAKRKTQDFINEYTYLFEAIHEFIKSPGINDEEEIRYIIADLINLRDMFNGVKRPIKPIKDNEWLKELDKHYDMDMRDLETEQNNRPFLW